MDNMFTVLPMSQAISLSAGEVYTGKITIVNPADATTDFQYKIDVSPYGVDGESYDANLSTETTRTQIANWIEISEPTGTLKPNETREVEYTIKVPENSPAGGQYAAITVMSNDDSAVEEGGAAVKNVFEMASLIYASIAGETNHDGKIEENNIPGFVLSEPITVTSKFTNNGNIHEAATIKLEVTDFMTGAKIFPADDNADENTNTYTELIMPETTRLLSRDINNLPLIGVVNVKQTIYYNGDVSIEEQNVIICPIWFMAAVAVVIGGIIALIVRKIVKRRKKRTI